MNKSELDLLEKVFIANIEGRFYQTKSKLAKRLEDEGFIVMDHKTLVMGRFGPITVTGYSLTTIGNYAYCTSERCQGEPDDI